jgi:hypothetical protein
MPETLFDTTPYAAEPTTPTPKMSAQRRLTIRQTAALNQGWHPLTVAAQHHNGPAAARLKLHPQAAPPDDRHAPGRRCGNCWYLNIISTGSARDWPKCVYGAQNPTDEQPRPGPPPRVTKGPGSDIRRWWPGCEDHSYGDPSTSDDAARYVPEASDA